MNHKPIEGFSKLSKQHKIDWLINEYLQGNQEYQRFFSNIGTIIQTYKNSRRILRKYHYQLLHALRNCTQISLLMEN